MTLPDDVEDVLDALPDDRDLLPDEVDAVAAALGADAVSSLTYSDESGAQAVMLTMLWWDGEPVGRAAILDRHPDRREWRLDDAGRSTFDGFADALDEVSEDMDLDRGSSSLVRLGPRGEVLDRTERDL